MPELSWVLTESEIFTIIDRARAGDKPEEIVLAIEDGEIGESADAES